MDFNVDLYLDVELDLDVDLDLDADVDVEWDLDGDGGRGRKEGRSGTINNNKRKLPSAFPQRSHTRSTPDQ